ncbi:MAG: glycoside hydrolase family 127 protein, partial [Lachnospiraceae bacterium]|nr:glycoside hydrolase family 127 protein [Lachnospiraceae bacterium]
MESANKRFAIKDAFFSPLEEKIRTVVLPYQEAVLKDEVEGVAKSHAVENFRAAAEVLKNGKCDTEFYGMVFQDSDVAKWLEAAAYSLQLTPDAELEEHCDRMIDIVAEAQHEDGYLNTYFTVKEPGRRWTDLSECHELYCAGHMIEAAVAYADATGKTKLLDVMCRFADHIYNHFITEGNPGFPGHEEIELALLRLYRKTGEERYKELSAHFLNARGDAGAYFQKESRERGWYLWGKDPAAPEYNQTHLPVREQKDAVGHAVRAVYLYTGMADLAAETGDESLKQACRNLYESITRKRMYLTGGIGSAYEGEAFTEDYHLPN